MELEKASLGDFDIITRLREDISAEMIYIPSTKDMKAKNASDKYFFDEETLKTLWSFHSYKWFVKDLESDYSFIFLIKDDDEIIGYFKVVEISRHHYKLAEWSMFKKYQHQKEDSWKLLLNYPFKSIKTISIAPYNAEQTIWFREHGFVGLDSFLTYKIDKKSP